MLTGNDLAKFRAALFEYSEVLDGTIARKPPQFSEGQNIVQFILRVKRFDDEEQSREGRQIFNNWRNKWAVVCSEYIRAYFAGKERGSKAQFPLIREANAIYTLLTFGPEQEQDEFLRGPVDFKRAIIEGLLADGGLYDAEFRWVELPPL